MYVLADFCGFDARRISTKMKSGMNTNAKPTETDIKSAYSSSVYHGSVSGRLYEASGAP